MGQGLIVIRANRVMSRAFSSSFTGPGRMHGFPSATSRRLKTPTIRRNAPGFRR
jgi:hypothetical protein